MAPPLPRPVSPSSPALTRRQFLRSSGSAAAAYGIFGHRPSSPPPTPAIDTHVHFYDPNRPGGVPWPKPSDPLYSPHLPKDFAALSAPSGVVGAIAIEASTWLEDNQWLLDLAGDNSSLVGVIGLLEPGTPEFARQLARFTPNPLFRGVRPHQLEKNTAGPRLDGDLERLAAAGLTLEAGGRPPVLPGIARIARDHPHLRIVVEHLPLTDWDGHDPAALRATLAELAACANVWAKASHVIQWRENTLVEDPAVYRPGLDVLFDLFGPDRLLYGTDWPKPSLQTTYARVHQVTADYFHAHGPAAAEKFFWRNSRAAYAWIPRGAAAALPR